MFVKVMIMTALGNDVKAQMDAFMDEYVSNNDVDTADDSLMAMVRFGVSGKFVEEYAKMLSAAVKREPSSDSEALAAYLVLNLLDAVNNALGQVNDESSYQERSVQLADAFDALSVPVIDNALVDFVDMAKFLRND